VWGIVRTILAAGAGYFVAKGKVDDATAQSIIGGIGAVFVGVWSVLSKKPA
jgi:hypothetical protein